MTASGTLRAECFMLCDFAQVAEGRLNVLGGGWNRVAPPRFAYPHTFFLAIKLSLPREHANRPTSVRVEMTNADGETVDPPILDVSAVANPSPDAQEQQDLPLALPVQVALTLDRRGRYGFTLFVEDQPIAETGFEVVAPRTAGSTQRLGPEEVFDPPVQGPHDPRLR